MGGPPGGMPGPMGGMGPGGAGGMPGGGPSAMMPNNPGLPQPLGPQMVQIKKCSKCSREVPDNLTAGDKCPHCGVFFGKDETNGKTAWSFSNMTGSARRGAIRLGITLACLAVGAVGWAIKKSKG